MKTLRIFLDALVVLTASTLLGFLAYTALGGTLPALATTIAIYVTDGCMVLAALCNIPRCREGLAILLLTAVPVLSLIVAGIMQFMQIEIPILLFVLYDFYLIYWYGYRTFAECHQERKWG